MRAVQVMLWTLGAAGIVFGCWLLVTTQRPEQLLGVAVWMLAALLVHDALLVPLLTATHRAVDAISDAVRRRRARV